MCLRLCACVSVCVSLCLCVSVSASLIVCACVWVRLYVNLCVRVFLRMSKSICVFACMCVILRICPPLCESVCPPVRISCVVLYMRVSRYLNIWVRVCACKFMRMLINVFMFVCVRVWVCVCAYVYACNFDSLYMCVCLQSQVHVYYEGFKSLQSTNAAILSSSKMFFSWNLLSSKPTIVFLKKKTISIKQIDNQSADDTT